MSHNALKLAAFMALAQHEVQQTLEYLALPEVRRVSQATPSQVLATVGNVKMSVPLQFTIAQSPRLPIRQPGARPEPGELLLVGAPWPPGSRMRYQLDVATMPAGVEIAVPHITAGTLQVEFITVLKQ